MRVGGRRLDRRRPLNSLVGPAPVRPRSGDGRGRDGWARSGEEVEQRRIELLGVGGVEPVRATLDEREGAARDRLVGSLAGDLERHDPVRVAVEDKGRHGDLREVVPEVGAPERSVAVERALRRGERRDVAVVEPDGLLNEEPVAASAPALASTGEAGVADQTQGLRPRVRAGRWTGRGSSSWRWRGHGRGRRTGRRGARQ